MTMRLKIIFVVIVNYMIGLLIGKLFNMFYPNPFIDMLPLTYRFLIDFGTGSYISLFLLFIFTTEDYVKDYKNHTTQQGNGDVAHDEIK